jgi:3-oxoacyl-[acyl-carrier protein] reductase
MDLSGAAVLVGGGAGQIGRALVTALLARGSHVAVTDRLEQAQTIFADNDILYHPGDAADEADCIRVVRRTVESLGAVDALVNCAGVIHNEPLINLLKAGERRHRLSTWDAVIRANLTSTFVLGSVVAEQMASTRTPGVIVNLSSVASAGNPGQSAYSAAKAGVEALTSAWAKELGLLGIRVVAVAPGFIDIASTHAALGEAVIKEWIRKTPLRRLGRTDAVISAIMFAIENDFLTGRTIQVDGGVVL